MNHEKENVIVDLTFKFALDIVRYSQTLEDAKKSVLSKQIAIIGTSIGANVRDAHNPEKKLEFMHKIKIAAEEADELKYLLLICNDSENYPDCKKLLEKLEVIIKSLADIISGSKKQIGFQRQG
jgi:four helix bundle protein